MSYSQTVQINLLKAPCNCDGEIELVTTGFTSLPLYVQGRIGKTNIIDTINSYSKTYKNYCGGTISLYVRNNSQQSNWGSNNFSRFNINTTSTPAVCPNPGTANATITGGVAPYTVKWINNQTNDTAATGLSVNLGRGSYRMIVKDANNCTYETDDKDSSRGFVFINYISGLSLSFNKTDANCTNGTASVTNLTGGVAPYTYLWSNGATSSSINNLIMGYYDVQVKDSRGCIENSYTYINQTKTINVNTTPTATTCKQNDGSAIVFGSGGSSPYTYLWSNGSTSNTITNVNSGFYYVTTTDNNGCIGVGSVNIMESTPINVTYSSTPSLCTSSTGSASLNITGGTQPYTITWYTTPILSTTTINNQAAGNYPFLVKDNVGCERKGSITIPRISSPTFDLYTNNAICPNNNGSISISNLSGVSPYSYSWNTGANSNSLSNLPQGNYSVTITDANNCKTIKSSFINSHPAFTSSVGSVPTTCIYSNDGSAWVNAVGTGPFTYLWSNGTTSATALNLVAGYHYVTIKDANGCSRQNYVTIENGNTLDNCYCTIKGNVYHDANKNCIKDNNEKGIENIMIQCAGIGYTFTDANGDYSFKVPSGNYTITQQVKSTYPLSNCQQNNIIVNTTAASGCVHTVNFADSLVPTHDLAIITMRKNNSTIFPGEIYNQKVLVKNMGNIPENTVKLSYKHDGQLNLINFSSQWASNGTNKLKELSSSLSLNPGEKIESQLDYIVPTNLPLGTTIVFEDTTSKGAPINMEWLNDESPWNNVNYYTQISENSYDPNYKEVFPKGKGNNGEILPSVKNLIYTIHFQNLGTADARKVVLMDALDKNLDKTTLTPIDASHKYDVLVDENGLMKITFDKIYLPSLSSGGDASNGYFTYSIKIKDNLPLKTQITNFADIYFDYNAPIRTNKTVNTIDSASNTNSITSISNEKTISIFPNPVKNEINIHAVENIEKANVSILSMNGTILTKMDTCPNKIDVSNLSSGLYILSVYHNNKYYVTKFLKE
jgi:hypothetical protein